MKKLLLIRGYPGSGKTTIGKKLEDYGYGTFIDHNSILTFIANIVGDDMGIYDNIHSLELALTNKLLGDGKSAIVARGFSKVVAISPYLEIAKKQNAKLLVITLLAAPEILEQRVTQPERQRDFNPTTNAEALRDWVMHNPLEPFATEVTLDASLPLSQVVRNARAFIDAKH